MAEAPAATEEEKAWAALKQRRDVSLDDLSAYRKRFPGAHASQLEWWIDQLEFEAVVASREQQAAIVALRKKRDRRLREVGPSRFLHEVPNSGLTVEAYRRAALLATADVFPRPPAAAESLMKFLVEYPNNVLAPLASYQLAKLAGAATKPPKYIEISSGVGPKRSIRLIHLCDVRTIAATAPFFVFKSRDHVLRRTTPVGVQRFDTRYAHDIRCVLTAPPESAAILVLPADGERPPPSAAAVSKSLYTLRRWLRRSDYRRGENHYAQAGHDFALTRDLANVMDPEAISTLIIDSKAAKPLAASTPTGSQRRAFVEGVVDSLKDDIAGGSEDALQSRLRLQFVEALEGTPRPICLSVECTDRPEVCSGLWAPWAMKHVVAAVDAVVPFHPDGSENCEAELRLHLSIHVSKKPIRYWRRPLEHGWRTPYRPPRPAPGTKILTMVVTALSGQVTISFDGEMLVQSELTGDTFRSSTWSMMATVGTTTHSALLEAFGLTRGVFELDVSTQENYVTARRRVAPEIVRP